MTFNRFSALCENDNTCTFSQSEQREDIMSIKLSHLNVNGWTQNNAMLRKNLLKHSKADFICVNETHLKKDDIISLPGYQWVGYNRTMQHVRAV